MTGGMRQGLTTQKLALVAVLSTVALGGCAEKKNHYVIAATGTSIGLDVSQNAATQTPQAKLGYHRGELAIVPTDRGSGSNGTGAGAAKSADVLMEIYFGTGLSSPGESTIYQRLAVGKDAVSQRGAGVMFAKGPDGKLDKNAQKALEAVKSIPAPTTDALKTLRRIDKIFEECQAAGKKDEFEKAVATVHKAGYADFHGNITSPDVVSRVLLAVEEVDC